MRGMLNVRLLLALTGAVAAAPQVFAQTLPASVIACADETDVLKRLSCYDREVARYRTHPAASTTAPGSTTAPAAASTAAGAGSSLAATASAAAPPSAPRSASAPSAQIASAGAVSLADQQAEFGMNGELKRKEQGPGAVEPVKLDKLSARIASLSYKAHGESILTLDDGQIWEEAENESHVPYHVGDAVTIKRGVLGAFYLSSAEVRGLRVKRVR
jgi:hypothetical protein